MWNIGSFHLMTSFNDCSVTTVLELVLTKLQSAYKALHHKILHKAPSPWSQNVILDGGNLTTSCQIPSNHGITILQSSRLLPKKPNGGAERKSCKQRLFWTWGPLPQCAERFPLPPALVFARFGGLFLQHAKQREIPQCASRTDLNWQSQDYSFRAKQSCDISLNDHFTQQPRFWIHLWS